MNSCPNHRLHLAHHWQITCESRVVGRITGFTRQSRNSRGNHGHITGRGSDHWIHVTITEFTAKSRAHHGVHVLWACPDARRTVRAVRTVPTPDDQPNPENLFIKTPPPHSGRAGVLLHGPLKTTPLPAYHLGWRSGWGSLVNMRERDVKLRPKP